MALVGHLTHYNLPPLRIPRLTDPPVPVVQAPLARRRENGRQLPASQEDLSLK